MKPLQRAKSQPELRFRIAAAHSALTSASYYERASRTLSLASLVVEAKQVLTLSPTVGETGVNLIANSSSTAAHVQQDDDCLVHSLSPLFLQSLVP
jgi:hypothetical protein